MLCIVRCAAQQITVTYHAHNRYPQEALLRVPALANFKTITRSELAIHKSSSRLTRKGVMVVSPNQGTSRTLFDTKETIYKNYATQTWHKTSALYKVGKGLSKSFDEVSRRRFNWTPTGKDSMIVGIRCLEVRDADEVAWYAPEIPVPDGPFNGVFGLPGLVLVLDLPNTGRWEAVELTFDSPGITFPDIEWVSDESRIRAELLGIERDYPGVITLDSTSPVGVWIGVD